MEDPTQRKALDEIEFAAGCKAIAVLARAGTLRAQVPRAYEKIGIDTGGVTLDGTTAEYVPEDAGKLLATLEQEGDTPETEMTGVIEQSDNSLVRLINSMILDAQSQGVSDIHIECQPGREKVRIRFRRDGVMKPYLELPHSYRNALIARIKIMCDLDISERRKPQDGKINFARFVPGQKLELRVATIPTAGNCEDAVMRLLASAKPLPLDKLNLSPHNLERLKMAVERPYGMILCVGPTGSGKTTTLHSALGFINTPDRKIWTAEDPIEITQSGLRQVQVNPKIELTFARALRAFLRADPDVIMVGEIRDKETAGTAIEASLTGHLVMSTLHTNSAAETVTRLLDMGMDPFNFADALLVVLAQRLVRRLCGHCARPREARPEEVDELLADYLHSLQGAEGTPGPDAVLADWNQRFARNGRLVMHDTPGCPHCDGSGYKGRAGLHELMHMTPTIRHLVQTGARSEEILKAALSSGLRTLRQDGIEKVLAGVTSVAEVRSTTNG
ncbi:MAG: type II/IV secretion system protein, partial [Rubrivivax sp.]|nr:type II/IV secretion system protein [Rubrivivax sp.]